MKKAGFTILFMICITAVFVFALTGVNEISRERIAKNQAIQRVQSIMYACNILPEGVHENNLSSSTQTSDINWDNQRLLSMMSDRLEIIHIPIAPTQKELLRNSFLVLQDSVEIYILSDERKKISGYGFSLRGKGLWGTIAAFAVISDDLTKMVGIDFTDQVETPGLGARITESWFKYLFRGLDLSGFLSGNKNEPAITMVSTKGKSNLDESTSRVQAITGATQTCNGVLKMINTDLQFYITLIQEYRDNDGE